MQHENGLRALLAASIAAFLAEMKPHLVIDDPHTTGFDSFDNLTREQQFVAVHEVGMTLLDQDAPPWIQTAYRQATLLAIFDCLDRNVRLEILDGTSTFRSLILAAHRDTYGKIDHGVTCDCADIKQWSIFIKCLRKRWVDEETLEMPDKIVDLSPELTADCLSFFGLKKDFHVAAPDDPTFCRAALLTKELYGRCLQCLHTFMNESLLPHLLNARTSAKHSL